jgi:hypothetical protein
MKILTVITSFASVLSSLTLLAHFTHFYRRISRWTSYVFAETDRIEAFAPSSVERSCVAASPVSLLVRRLSAMRRLSFFLLLMITLLKQQASGMFFIPPQILITLKFSRFDIYNAFNTKCLALTLDVLNGCASSDYACGIKQIDVIIDTCASVSNMFGYFQAMRTCHANVYRLIGKTVFPEIQELIMCSCTTQPGLLPFPNRVSSYFQLKSFPFPNRVSFYSLHKSRPGSTLHDTVLNLTSLFRNFLLCPAVTLGGEQSQFLSQVEPEPQKKQNLSFSSVFIMSHYFL